MANSRLRRRYVAQRMVVESATWAAIADILGDNADTQHDYCDAAASTYLDWTNAPTTDSGNGYSWLEYLTWIVNLDYEGNLTVAQRRAVATIAGRLWRWKGTKSAAQAYLSNVVNRAAAIYVGIESGGPPHEYAAVIPDFYDRESTAADTPSWPIVDNFFDRFNPSHCRRGIGYSQFRADHSRAGEPVFSTTAFPGSSDTLNLIDNENFAERTGANWDVWGEVTGGGGTLAANVAEPEINGEFTDNCVQADTGGASQSAYVHQTIATTLATTYLVDVVYENPSWLDAPRVVLYDGTASKYWDFTEEEWTASVKYAELTRQADRYTQTWEVTGSGNNVTMRVGFTDATGVTGTNQLLLFHAGIYTAQSNTLAA
jgi:hypothetical protein